MKIIKEVGFVEPGTIVKIMEGCTGSNNATGLTGVVIINPKHLAAIDYQGQLPEHVCILIRCDDGQIWGLPKECVLQILN